MTTTTSTAKVITDTIEAIEHNRGEFLPGILSANKWGGIDINERHGSGIVVRLYMDDTDVVIDDLRGGSARLSGSLATPYVLAGIVDGYV